MKKCKECKKEILGGYYNLASIGKEYFGKEFYVCVSCMEKFYERKKEEIKLVYFDEASNITTKQFKVLNSITQESCNKSRNQ